MSDLPCVAGVPPETESGVEIHVARQPILDANRQLFAYELLFRSGPANAFDGTEENRATASVISTGFLSPAAEHVRGGKLAFVNFPRRHLLDGSSLLLPAQEVVIEILENVKPDDDVLAACHDLKQRGYRLAVDDFVLDDGRDLLARLADFIKVDFRANTIAEQEQIAQRYGRNTCLLAEKVETWDEYLRARQQGYAYFQGYLFSRPVMMMAREQAGSKLNYVRLLRELNRPELGLRQVAHVLRGEPGLCYKLLRYINSAVFPLLSRVRSIHHALVMLGEVNIRRWLSIVVLLDLSADQPSGLVVAALVRGRFSEMLALRVGMVSRAPELFLMGAFSLLDAIFGYPLERLLEDLSLSEEISQVLLGQPPAGSTVARIWTLVKTYEAADWAHADVAADDLRLDMGEVAQIYSESVVWSDRSCASIAGPVEPEELTTAARC